MSTVKVSYPLAEVAARESRAHVQPTDNLARARYTALGFVETGATEDHEVVARLTLDP